MPITSTIDGHGRKTLFSGVAASIPGSTGLGVYDVSQFSRFGGLFSVTGSVTLQWRMGINSGTYQVTSSVVVNSGPAILDVINYGRFVEFGFSAANSQQPTYYVFGEPLR